MINELAFALEGGVCSKAGARRTLKRVANFRIPRFGVIGTKFAQVVANRPDVRVPFDRDSRNVVTDTLARVNSDDGSVTASLATVTRRGPYAIKLANDRYAAQKLAALSYAVRALDKQLDEQIVAPIADEAKFETELPKNRAFRDSLDPADTGGHPAFVTVPIVHSATRHRVVMDFEPSVLVKDIGDGVVVDIRDVRRFFRRVVTAAASTGVVHADLHSANVGVRLYGASSKAARRARFVVYDFGAIRSIPPPRPSVHRVASLCEALFWNDWDSIARIGRESGAIVGSTENVRDIALSIERYARGDCDISGVRPAFEAAGGDIRTTADVATFATAVASLEATCKRMNPEFDAARALLSEFVPPFFEE